MNAELRGDDDFATARPMAEDERLAVFAQHRVHALEDDPELDALTKFAAKLCGAEIALVSLVDRDVQTFLTREGIEARSTERKVSFCQHAMSMPTVMEVRDATLDPRFKDNALVTGEPYIRFYAGAPLVSREGAALGALCVISSQPRPGGLTEFQRQGLKVLAQAVMRKLTAWRDEQDARDTIEGQVRHFDAMADAMPQMAWSTDAEGNPDYFNRRWYEFTGADEGEHHGDSWVRALHPDDAARAAEAWNQAVRTRQPYEVEYRMRRHDGEWRWTLARGLPLLNDEGEVVRWYGTNTDVHDRRQLEEGKDLLSRELSHRIKNIFALVGGLIHAETRGDTALIERLTPLRGRIDALSRAHDYVDPEAEARSSRSLRVLLEELAKPYERENAGRIQYEGDDAMLSEAAMTPFALLLHELLTNAAKHGALSRAEGRVVMRVASDADSDELLIDWVERGGPDAQQGADGPRGFGSAMVEKAVTMQLGGALERSWSRDGLTVAVRCKKARCVECNQ